MDFTPGEDAVELRELTRRFLDAVSGEEDVRRSMAKNSDFDRDVWARAAQEIGLQGLAIPDSMGGSGCGPVELGMVFEEMGAALFCGPFLATVGLAATALLECVEDEAAGPLLADVAAGNLIATLAWSGGEPGATSLRAEEAHDTWQISGTAPIVLDGAVAELIVVPGVTDHGLCLFAVPGDSVRRTPLSTLDLTRPLARIEFDRSPGRLLAEGDRAIAALRRATDLGSLYLAAEQLGGARRVTDMAVRYAAERVQFGRAIGSFQAIKHRCADMLIETESARSVVYHGLWTAVYDPAGLAVSASLAQSVASDAYRSVALKNVQIHGGIGFTWEHPAHLYVKRAKSSQMMFGSPASHRARLADLIELSGPPGHTCDSSPPDDPTVSDGESGELDDALLQELENFLSANPEPGYGDVDADRRWREARFDAGLAVVHLSPGEGGRGLAAASQGAVEQFFVRAGAPSHWSKNIIGLGMAMPTIAAHGTSEQRGRYLRPCFTGKEIWCQLFSEPGAGSDLAGLNTRAVRDGDAYVVNGQKVWTSLGHLASWGLLLARTNPDVPKHKGLTYFIVDMKSTGIDVRPLRQLTGEAEFNEVYLTDVRIPCENVLGEVDGGWRVAMTTLSNERVSLGSQPKERGHGPIAHLVNVYRKQYREPRPCPASADAVMRLWALAEAARLTNIRTALEAGQPGPSGSVSKLQMAELNQAIFELAVELSGNDGLLIDNYDEFAPSEASPLHGGSDIGKGWLRSLANSIEGGTSEILRTVIGERVLGLPSEPRADKDVAWKDTRRS